MTHNGGIAMCESSECSLLCGVPDAGRGLFLTVPPEGPNGQSKQDIGEYRDDKTMDYPLRNCNRAGPRAIGLH
jgi:hypothetical protein